MTKKYVFQPSNIPKQNHHKIYLTQHIHTKYEHQRCNSQLYIQLASHCINNHQIRRINGANPVAFLACGFICILWCITDGTTFYAFAVGVCWLKSTWLWMFVVVRLDREPRSITDGRSEHSSMIMTKKWCSIT